MWPAPKNAGTDANNFKPEAKDSKPSAPASSKDGKKNKGETSAATLNSSVTPEKIITPIIAENVPAQTLASSVTTTAKTIESGMESSLASNPADHLAGLPEGQIITPASSKIAQSVTPQSEAGIGRGIETKAGAQEKMPAAIKTLAAEKIILPGKAASDATDSSPQTPSPAKSAGTVLPAPIVADKPYGQPPQSGLPSSPNLQEKSPPQSEPEKLGTSVAQQDVPMKKTRNYSETAMATGKNLPGAAISAGAGKNLPLHENAAGLTLSRSGQMMASVVANSSLENLPVDAAQPSADLAAGAASADLRLRTLNRVQDMVVLHAGRFSDSVNVSLQVVLKPGAGTQMSLELRQRGDGVEAQAVLQRGDFGHLNQQWPALQQQLEQRGIRLAPLTSDVNFAGGEGAHNFQDKQKQSDEPNLFPAGAFAGNAPAGLQVQMAADVETHRGWQSWA